MHSIGKTFFKEKFVRQRTSRPSLIERALIEKEWHQTLIDAQIHALYGNNPQGLVDAAGRVLFVVLEAAIIDKYDFDRNDIRSISEAVISMYDQVDDIEICQDRRNRIMYGLESAEQMIALIRRSSLVHAACKLKERLHNNHIHLNDFDALIMRSKVQDLCQSL